MHDALREELEAILSPSEVEALLTRVEDRIRVDRELDTLGLGPLHYHEALDRAHVATVFVETHLAEHPVVRRHAHLGELCDAALQALFELYQAIGRLPDPEHEP